MKITQIKANFQTWYSPSNSVVTSQEAWCSTVEENLENTT